MSILLSVTGFEPTRWSKALQEHLPQDEIVTRLPRADDPAVDYAVVWKQPPGILSDLPNLKAVLSLGAGVDHILADKTVPDVPIVRIVADDLTRRMVEYVVWRVLDHFRKGATYRHQQEASLWIEKAQPGAGEVTIGILGLGELGRASAEALAPFGFRLAGWSRTRREVEGVACFHGPGGLHDCLALSDIVVVLLPLTPQTRGLIDDDFLSHLKHETPLGRPILINAGRGGLQRDSAILRALNDGRLMEASLDVFEREPLPKDSALWRHPQVFVTPHAAASSEPEALSPVIARSIEAHRKGKTLANLVDRYAGY